jgi:protoporphyrinogen oxidase
MRVNTHSRSIFFSLLILLIVLLGFFTCQPLESRAGEARQADVVIVGGGLSGLITAYELQNLGITAHLIEASDVLGGRVATADYGNGLHAEYGLHELWEKDPISEYVKKFAIPVTKSGEAYSSVIIDGKLYPYIQDNYKEYSSTIFTPDEKKEFSRWQKECEILYDEAETRGLTQKLVPLQDMSFGKWVGSLKLPPRVVEFIRLGMECEFAADWDSVSALYGILQCRMFIRGSEPSYHAKNGNQALINALARAIKGPRTLGARVTRIVRVAKPDGSTECSVYYMKNKVMETITCKKVVVAIPYQLLHAIQFEPTLTDEQWKAVETLTPGLYTVVHFIIDTEANKMLLINGKNPFPILTRGPLGVIYGFLETPPPSKKEEIFSLLIFGDTTRSYLEPQDKLRTRYLAELDKIWPGVSKYVRAAYFYGYHPVATPCFPPGRSPLDALSISLRKENVGMYLAGDYIYSSHAEGTVLSGREAAKKIARDLKKK